MAPTVHLSCLLALLVAGLAQGTKGSLRGQDPGPQPLELKEVFRLFQMQYNRSYPNPAEHARRLDIFAQNLANTQRLQEDDLGTAEFGVTQFSDLTEEEFVQLYGNQVAGEALGVSRKVGSEEWGHSVPSTCDWRKAGTISPVRDQQHCNCCWAIAAAGNIEALWAIKFHQSVEVSVQQLIDCDRCGNGCKGGFVWDAFLTVLNNRGLASEKDYPFDGSGKTHSCRAEKHKKVAWIQDFIILQACEQSIARHLATQGPITVTINMTLLQHYRKGVIKATPTTCDPIQVNHSVLLVGFGKTKSVEGRQGKAASFGSYSRPRHSMAYWTLKNSWGTQWGEKGYFRLHRGSNTCGITKFPVTARVDKPNKQQQVSCPP
ncbi:cathepsin W isoform X1 [Odocoileus virginianus]|uniref:Cathepsin W n=1 Tax=Odocoileus virginianus TaxID=9874 RepID=A0A6J0YLJ7_ODOVR|nr:cathepsin W [Odocoileus virginianus texanus]